MDSGISTTTEHESAQGNYETAPRKGSSVNVGAVERMISAAAGGALLVYGARRRSRLGTLLALTGGNLLLRGALGKSLIYRAFGFSTAGNRHLAKGSIHVEKSALIDRPPEEIYRFWRNFENLPRIMEHLRAVRSIDDRTSHWVAKGPAGMEVEWDAELLEDQENRRIAWRSLEGSDVHSRGAVTFEPASDGRSTLVNISLDYQLPGKAGAMTPAGAALAKLFGEEPEQQISEDLIRFKHLIESGEMATARG